MGWVWGRNGSPQAPVGLLRRPFGGVGSHCLEVGSLGLDRAQLGAERGEPHVVGGVRGQRGGQLGLASGEPVELTLQPCSSLRAVRSRPRAGARRGGTRPAGPGGPAARSRSRYSSTPRPRNDSLPSPSRATTCSVARSRKCRSWLTTTSEPGQPSEQVLELGQRLDVQVVETGSSSSSTLGSVISDRSSCRPGAVAAGQVADQSTADRGEAEPLEQLARGQALRSPLPGCAAGFPPPPRGPAGPGRARRPPGTGGPAAPSCP